jgi:RimJ/RimL family protein N-acetyltransferase
MITIRAATMSDAADLFDWRNDPQTRAMSRDTGPVAWADHVGWLERTLTIPDARKLCVLEIDREPAGIARFDYGDEVEFSVTIAPKWRCKGLSLKLLRAAFTIEPEFVGYVKRENKACQRLIQAAGMLLAEDGDMQRWTYHPTRLGRCIAFASPSLRVREFPRPRTPRPPEPR